MLGSEAGDVLGGGGEVGSVGCQCSGMVSDGFGVGTDGGFLVKETLVEGGVERGDSEIE